jgi:hypothetical protein
MRPALWAAALLWLGVPRPAGAEPPSPEPQYAYGIVAGVSEGRLLIREFDDASGGIVEVPYALDAEVAVEPDGALSTVAVGDDVDLDYVVQGGTRIATFIAVSKPRPDEAAADVEALAAE